MASPDATEITMTVGSLLAPLYFGLLFAIAFEGVLISQWYMYWKTYYNKDSVHFVRAVHALCLLELFHSITILHAGYWYFIQLWGRDDQLENAAWSIIVELALTILVSFVGRSFWIAWLIRLSRNWWLVGVAGCLALAQLGLGILEVYKAIREPFFSTLLSNKVAVIIQMVASDLGDVIIAAGLSYYLHIHRTGHKKTELVLDRLMRFIVTRGLLAAVMGVGQLVTFVIWPTTFIFGAFHLMFSKIYTNALLATLNGRDYIAGPLSAPAPSADLTGTSLAMTSVVPSSSTGIRVRIVHEESVELDEMPTKITSLGSKTPPSQSYTSAEDGLGRYSEAFEPPYKRIHG